MKKVFLIIIVLVIIGVTSLSYFSFFVVGSPLCGPLCPSFGPHYWERSCVGYVFHKPYIDGYSNICIGLPVGAKRCYGVPSDKKELTRNGSRLPDELISCPD